MTEALTPDQLAAERELKRRAQLRLRLAQHLSAIEDLYEDLEAEAMNRYDDHELPGGDAMVMLGPSANMEAWQHRIDTAEARYFEAIEEGRAASWPEISDHDSDPAPPLLVLATWEDVLREERGQPTYLRATVPSAAKYLRDAIDWMIDNFLAVDEVARDLANLRTRLEGVLRATEQVDRGVPCLACGRALILDWGATEEDDRWRCGTCRTWSSREQYALAVKADYLKNAPALTAIDIEAHYRIKASRVRVWGARFKKLRRGRNDDGRLLYDVVGVLDKRDELDGEGVA